MLNSQCQSVILCLPMVETPISILNCNSRYICYMSVHKWWDIFFSVIDRLVNSNDNDLLHIAVTALTIRSGDYA